jgi:hypothetical protein
VVVVMSCCVDTTKTEGVQGSGVWHQPTSEPSPALSITGALSAAVDCSSTSVAF